MVTPQQEMIAGGRAGKQTRDWWTCPVTGPPHRGPDLPELRLQGSTWPWVPPALPVVAVCPPRLLQHLPKPQHGPCQPRRAGSTRPWPARKYTQEVPSTRWGSCRGLLLASRAGFSTSLSLSFLVYRPVVGGAQLLEDMWRHWNCSGACLPWPCALYRLGQCHLPVLMELPPGSWPRMGLLSPGLS